jgi:hypothetical protein
MHLWPLTLAELAGERCGLDAFLADPLGVESDEKGEAQEVWDRLAGFSGFPEPYLHARKATYTRWSRDYHAQLIREDIRDLTGIRDVTDVETLFMLLPERVGSLLSISALAGVLGVAYNTLRNWLGALERFYLTFSIVPWTQKVARATRKARKVYLFDYAIIENRAARFENMVALELFRAVSTWNDLGLGAYSLHFVRNKEKEEVDFLIAEKGRPLLLIETKFGETTVESSLKRFQEQLGVPAVQLLNGGKAYRKFSNGTQSILVAPASMWLPRLP